MDNIITLPQEDWDAFMAALNAPAKDMPKLRALMQRPSPFFTEEVD